MEFVPFKPHAQLDKLMSMEFVNAHQDKFLQPTEFAPHQLLHAKEAKWVTEEEDVHAQDDTHQ